ncbi:MAG: peptidyl-prolyl cis-trans isomerase [Nitritalea sp.]
MKIKRQPILLLLLLLLSSCDLFRLKSDENEEINPKLAEVGNQVLRMDDVRFLYKTPLSTMDSSQLLEAYVKSWVKKQLMIAEASQSVKIDEAEVNRKLLDYRYALLVYELERQFVEKNLDKSIQLEEVEAYYAANKENFILKDAILRVQYFKVAKGNDRAIKKILSLVGKEDEKSLSELRDVALNSTVTHFVETNSWIKWGELAAGTPLETASNVNNVLRRPGTLEFEDEDYAYIFHVLEYKLYDEYPPMEFVEAEIRKILQTKRQAALVEQLEREIYERALEKKEFKIYE